MIADQREAQGCRLFSFETAEQFSFGALRGHRGFGVGLQLGSPKDWKSGVPAQGRCATKLRYFPTLEAS